MYCYYLKFEYLITSNLYLVHLLTMFMCFLDSRFAIGGSIPDAAMIHAARKHRAQAREMGGLADYVRLEDMPDYEREQQATMSSARLVREDENDKSDEEERDDGRLDFSVDLLTKDKQQRREAFMAAEREGAFRTTLLTESFKTLMIKRADEVGDGNASDASDDEDGWERQQFQKAIRQRQFESAQQEMHLHQRYIEGSPSSSAIAYHRSSPLAEQQQPPSRSLSGKAPDLAKLAPLASPLELQQKLSKRFLFDFPLHLIFSTSIRQLIVLF